MEILLIDDSRAVHSLATEMLTTNRITLKHAFNGQEGIELITKSDFNVDLILLDWEMPVMSGIDALPILKKMRPDVSIIMMTSKSAINDITMALSLGASDYIIKPYTRDILVGKISQTLRQEIA